MNLAKIDTAKSFLVGPILDADGVAVTTTLTRANINVSKNGTVAASNASSTLTHSHTGNWVFAANAADISALGEVEFSLNATTNAMKNVSFQVVTANIYDSFSSTDILQSDLIQMGGVAQSGTDLKDFADAGYDPGTNKIEGVKLADTLTTYTSNTPQSADNNTILTNATYGNAAIRTRGDIAWITGAGGSAPTVEQIAAEVWDTLIASHVGVTTFGGKNQLVVPSETLADYKATGFATPTNITAGTITTVSGNVDGTVTGKTPSEVGDAMNLAADAIKAVSYDESTAFPVKSADTGATQIARVGADGDTLETISDQIDLQATETKQDLQATLVEQAKIPKSDGAVTWNATALASVNAEVDTALNTAIPGSPTAKSINDYIVLSKYAVCNRWDIVEASGNLDVYDDNNTLYQATAAAFTTLAGVTLRKKIL